MIWGRLNLIRFLGKNRSPQDCRKSDLVAVAVREPGAGQAGSRPRNSILPELV